MIKITRISLILLVITINKAFALNLIRDSQTENYLKKISQPIFQAANLKSNVNIHIINDNNINAFVTTGNNMFINTGTIIYSDNPLGLIGVIAHETGHLTGNHISKLTLNTEEINKKMALGYILGIATALSGNIEAGQAIIIGNQHIAERQFFQYSIKHEEAADESALKFLDQCQISSAGLLDFFKNIRNQEKIYYDMINPYTRTHPLSSNRIFRINKHLKESPFSKNILDQELQDEHKIIKAKIEAFLNNPNEILAKYVNNQNHDIIAQIIAYHKLGDSKKSLELFTNLSNYDNLYIQELKGQILYEAGFPKESVQIFTKLIKSLPQEILIKIQFAGSVISANDSSKYQLAIDELNKALIIEKENIMAWDFLAKLYHANQNKLMSFYALAEASLLKGEHDLSIKYAQKAQDLVTDDTNHIITLKIKELMEINNSKLKEK